MNLLAFRVLKSGKDGNGYVLKIDPNEIENPEDKKELLLIQMPDNRHGMRRAFYRDEEWLMFGVIRKGRITLFKDDYE